MGEESVPGARAHYITNLERGHVEDRRKLQSASKQLESFYDRAQNAENRVFDALGIAESEEPAKPQSGLAKK